jgi:hypothetical protein
MQKEFDRYPLEKSGAVNTFNRLGSKKISEMNIEDEDKN